MRTQKKIYPSRKDRSITWGNLRLKVFVSLSIFSISLASASDSKKEVTTNQTTTKITSIHRTVNENNKTISGTVIGEDGMSIPGVSVIVKGSTVGTITDFDGNYTLKNIKQTDVLVFSFVGLAPQEIAVGDLAKIDVTMKSDAVAIEEIVAVGYGVKKKSVVTGSISSIDTDELLQNKPTNASQALNGRAAGVIISPKSGQPGSAPTVVIRGIGTNGNSSPLYVVDGLPMDDINAVNPNDIASMEVLKDATSAAIYGARAANGVILITTKKGKKGKTSFNYDGFYGWQKAYPLPDMMNTAEYTDMVKTYYRNDHEEKYAADGYPDWINNLDPNVDTDWFDVITKIAPVQEHSLSSTFGSEKGMSMISLGYRDQDGVVSGDNSYYKRYTARFNTTQNITERLTIGANMSALYVDKSVIGAGGNGYNPLSYALFMDPTTPVYAGPGTDYPDRPYDENGYGISPTNAPKMINPVTYIDMYTNHIDKNKRFYGNAFLEYEVAEGLKFKTDFGVRTSVSDYKKFVPSFTHLSMTNPVNYIEQRNTQSSFWQWENTLTYTKSFDKHNIAALLGNTVSRNTWEQLYGKRSNLPADEANNNDDWWYLNGGDVTTSSNKGTANPVHSLLSVFGRLSYDYNNKYMAEVVVRRDGSSNFGPNNRYAIFPGVSAGWNISSEDFWDIENFDLLKVRTSWGQNGNEAISPLTYTSIIGNSYNYVFGNEAAITTGSSPKSLMNPDVRWETSEQFSIGTDMAFYNSKLRFSFDYYTKETKDLLLQPFIGNIRGNTAAYSNVGAIKNSGVEMQLTYKGNAGDVNYTINANAAYLKNEVTAVGNDNGYIEVKQAEYKANREIITRMEEGMPLGYFIGYKTEGIFQNAAEVDAHRRKDGTLVQPNAKPGDLRFKANPDGKGTLNAEDDRYEIGNPWPKWTFGLNFAAQWKGFDFSTFVTGKLDLDVFSNQYRHENSTHNLPRFYNDAWTKEGDKTDIPRHSMVNTAVPSDFFLYDASFFKIGAIEVGYNLPASMIKRCKFSKVRIYCAMDNVAVFSKYPFGDPEVGSVSDSNILTTGIDRGIYPQARTTRVGISIGL